MKDTDMALFTDKSHEMWMELSMRLSNDAFEGQASADAGAQSASVEKLDETIAMMRKNFGTSSEDVLLEQPTLSDAAKATITKSWSHYNAVHAALADDDLAKTQSVMAMLAAAVEALEASQLPQAAQDPWLALQETVSRGLGTIRAAKDLDGARVPFEEISTTLEVALRTLGSDTPVHVMHCAMALDGRGARWLQESDSLLNPYFGSSMLRCGSTLEVIKPRGHDSDK